MKTSACEKNREGSRDQVVGRLIHLAWAALIIGVLPMHRASATPIIGGPNGALAFKINAGPLLVDTPGRFLISGVLYLPPVHIFPGVREAVTVTQPGDYRFTLFQENAADSRLYYSFSMVDRLKKSPVVYTLRFELLPGSCPAMSAVSNNAQLMVVAGRPLALSILRRPSGRPTGPQLMSTPRVLCVNPQAEASLLFYPMVDNFLPVELQMTHGAFSSVTELVVPL